MKERIQCSREQRQICPLRNHVYNIHHKYWPASRYVTPLQQEFRELEGNKEAMCTYEHVLLHKEQRPPKMPGVEQMLEAVMRPDE